MNRYNIEPIYMQAYAIEMHFECCGVELTPKNHNRNLRDSLKKNIFCIYRPPFHGEMFKTFISCFDKFVDKFKVYKNSTIICGDLNIDFISDQNPEKDIFYDSLESASIINIISEARRIKTGLDYVMINKDKVDQILKIEVTPPMSDHSGQIVTMIQQDLIKRIDRTPIEKK